MGHFFNGDGSYALDDNGAPVEKGIRDAVWQPVGSDASQQTTEQVSVTARNATSKSLSPTQQYELSIAVNAAVNAICRNISKAKLRLFARNGEEINGGELYELLRRPAPGLTSRKLVSEITAWLNIAGEFFINQIRGDDGKPIRLLPLCPFQLTAKTPLLPRTPGDIVTFQYTFPDGKVDDLPALYVAWDRLFNPNAGSWRGLSPLVTGAVQVSGSYYAERYNKQFFENGAIPSHLLILPDGVPRSHREDITKRYTAEYGNWAGNAHKVMVMAGKDVKVEHLEQPFQDGAFMEMQKRGDLKVGQLYRVPAINMGIYDKTRFDTANEERKLFLEETLQPQCELISDALQSQVVDRFFANSKFTVARPRKPGKTFESKSLETQFEKARAERGDPAIVVLIDTDTLPVAHDVKLAMTESAQKMRDTYMMSPRAVGEWAGLDQDDERPERDEIWAENKYVCVTKPSLNAALVPGVKPDGEKPPAKKDDVEADEVEEVAPVTRSLSDSDKARIKTAERLFRKLRRLSLQHAEAGTCWSLAEADELNETKDEALKAEIRRQRHLLRRSVLPRDDRAKAVRDHFNHIDRPHYRKALGL